MLTRMTLLVASERRVQIINQKSEIRNSMEAPRVQTEIQVMFFDTDCAAVVHNIAYLRFIEIARTLLAEQLGMGLRDMSVKGQFPVVVRTEIDYRRPAVLGDKLVVEGWLDSVDR